MTKLIIVSFILLMAGTAWGGNCPLQQWESTSFGKDPQLIRQMHLLWDEGHKAEYIGLAIQIIIAEKTIDAFQEDALHTDWVGAVAVANDDQYFGGVGWLSGTKLGLRSDGVLVWRK